MNTLKTLLATAILTFSTTSLANGVMMEMFQMKKQLNVLTQAETSESFQEAAKQFLEVSEKAKNTMPASLEGDQERFKGYQQGMDDVIGVVKNANELAKQGKLEEAKATLSVLDGMRKHYHKEYK